MNFGKVIAHRGASGYLPENTLVAFKKAKELGAQWIECDAKLTWDNQIVIFHDHRLERLTHAKGWVRFTKYTDLVQLDIGLGEHVVSLEELLNLCEEIGLSINIEIKPDWGRVRKTTQKIMDILAKKPVKNIHIVISSFNRKSLFLVRKLNKTIPISLLMEPWNPYWQFTVKRLKCISVNCDKHILTHERVLAIKKMGCMALAYTVNDRKEAEKLYAMGVDAVFSDYPDLLRR